MNRADDARARALAQSVFDRPLILEAGAGTGKTTALVARIICWILGPGWEAVGARLQQEHGRDAANEERAARVLEGVVAITFTEAAAAEMETRVGSVLAEIANGKLPEYLLLDSLPTQESERAERAENLLAALDRLQVRTIHSWCHRILARFPLEAGLHPDFQVDAEGRMREEAAHEVVEEHLRRAYRDQVDPALLILAADGRGPNDLADALGELAGEGLRARELERSPFGPEQLDIFWAEFSKLLEEPGDSLLRELESVKRAGNTQVLVDWIRQTVRELSDAPPGNQRELENYLEKVPEDSTRKSLNKLEQWGKGKFTKGEQEVLGSKEMDFLSGYAPRLRSWVQGLQRLDPARLEAARMVLHPLLEELERRLHTLGVLSYEDLLNRCHELLEADNGVRQLLREEIDQLLVDEFQDTNALQCSIVARLALQGPEKKRPGLFLVGDPKQSIYGWRGAELSSYHSFVEKIEQDHGPRQFLSVNFRSVPSILREVERAVAPVMHEKAGDQPAFQELLASEQNEFALGHASKEQKTIEHWVSGMVKTDEALDPGGSGGATRLEARYLVSDLLQLQRDAGSSFLWSEVGLLYRSGGDLELYLRRMREAGIPYSVENDRQYYRRREIMDAVALLSCVLEPANQLAMVAFLRSPWVGVPDAAWLGLWRHGFPGQFARVLNSDAGKLDELEASIEACAAELESQLPVLDRISGWPMALREAVRRVAALRESYEQDAPEDFVLKLRRWILAEEREASRFLGPYRAANLERFFRLLRDALCDLGEDPATLLRQLRRGVLEETEAQEGRLQASARDAVRVMTIHKAKGLDFDHVYLLQAHKRGRGQSRSKRTEVTGLKGSWEYQLLGYPSLGWQAAIDRGEEVGRYERVRLLYVALTRPKRRLVILGLRAEGNGDPQRAHTLAELLGPRSEAAGLNHAALASLEAKESSFLEEAGSSHEDEVLWRLLPAEAVDGEGVADQLGSHPLAPLSEVFAQESQLARSRQSARVRMSRPFRRAASAGGHEDLRRAREDRQAEARAPGELMSAHEDIPLQSPERNARVAMVAGSAVHAVLEHYALQEEPERAWKDALAWMEIELAQEPEAETRDAARERVGSILGPLQSSDLLDRLRTLAPHLLGREIPILLAGDAQDETAPVGYHPGTIDLLYRDPDSGEIVVADFKTDRVDTTAELEARVLAYREQGVVYQRAIAEALGLRERPRFELWFLRADRIEVCP